MFFSAADVFTFAFLENLIQLSNALGSGSGHVALLQFHFTRHFIPLFPLESAIAHRPILVGGDRYDCNGSGDDKLVHFLTAKLI